VAGEPPACPQAWPTATLWRGRDADLGANEGLASPPGAIGLFGIDDLRGPSKQARLSLSASSFVPLVARPLVPGHALEPLPLAKPWTLL